MIYKRKLDFLAGFLISALMLACRVYYISIVSDPSVLTSAHLASFLGSRVLAELGNEASAHLVSFPNSHVCGRSLGMRLVSI